MKSKMTRFYKFDFDKGVPIIGTGQLKWRSGVKTIPAYCLQNAVEKFAMPVFRQYGTSAKLNVVKAFVSEDKKEWKEISLTETIFAAFLVGCVERIKARQL